MSLTVAALSDAAIRSDAVIQALDTKVRSRIRIVAIGAVDALHLVLPRVCADVSDLDTLPRLDRQRFGIFKPSRRSFGDQRQANGRARQ